MMVFVVVKMRHIIVGRISVFTTEPRSSRVGLHFTGSVAALKRGCSRLVRSAVESGRRPVSEHARAVEAGSSVGVALCASSSSIEAVAVLLVVISLLGGVRKDRVCHGDLLKLETAHFLLFFRLVANSVRMVHFGHLVKSSLDFCRCGRHADAENRIVRRRVCGPHGRRGKVSWT